MSPLIQRNGLMVKLSPAPSMTQIITETSSRKSILMKEVSKCNFQIIDFVAVCAFVDLINILMNLFLSNSDKGTPKVTIYKPDNYTDHVSLVCEVTSPKLGDVYIMWKVGNEPYIEGRTSAPILREDSTSVLSILTIPKEKYENPQTTVTCAVKHANMDNTSVPLQVTTSQSKQCPECPVY